MCKLHFCLVTKAVACKEQCTHIDSMKHAALLNQNASSVIHGKLNDMRQVSA